MAEFDEELETLFADLGGGNEFCWPREQVFVETYGTIGFLENGGPMSFWTNDITQKRVIRSFRKIGAVRLATILEELQEDCELIASGGNERPKLILGEDRFKKYSDLENEMFDECERALMKVREYVAANQIRARPLGSIGRICGALRNLWEEFVFWVRH